MDNKPVSQNSFGIVEHDTERPTDYLYRVSLKCLIRNEAGDVLVVKEKGRDWWDLPGGGMDHGESLRLSIAREMYEEVAMTGDFSYRVIAVDEPMYLDSHNFWQTRLIFAVEQENASYSVGEDCDEIAFLPPKYFKDSKIELERRVYSYCNLNG